MRRGIFVVLFILLVGFVSMINFVSASDIACKLSVSLLNQDPYPAVPGDYVKLVFQVSGVDNANCNDIAFNLLQNYPIEFNPGESGVRVFKRVDYIKDFKSSILIPYKVKINKDAIDGKPPIEIKVQSKNSAPISKTFNLSVKDVRAKFEVYVKNYNYATDQMTLEILNTGASKIEAVSVQIPKQDTVQVKGANRMIVGDLDSNEYTSADFEASLLHNEKFKVNISYSDIINVRRTVEKTVTFDSSYFTNRKADQKTTSVWVYIFGFLIILFIVYWIYKKRNISTNKKRH